MFNVLEIFFNFLLFLPRPKLYRQVYNSGPLGHEVSPSRGTSPSCSPFHVFSSHVSISALLSSVTRQPQAARALGDVGRRSVLDTVSSYTSREHFGNGHS